MSKIFRNIRVKKVMIKARYKLENFITSMLISSGDSSSFRFSHLIFSSMFSDWIFDSVSSTGNSDISLSSSTFIVFSGSLTGVSEFFSLFGSTR